MSDMTNEVLSRFSHIAKTTYRLLRMRAQRIDNYDPPDKKYGKIWEEVARICIQRRINPSEYIEVQFHCLRPFPELNNLTSEAALERYYDQAMAYAASYASEYTIQLHTLERMLGIGRELRSALMDEDQGFDPLFIYAVASANGMMDLADKLEEPALCRFLTSVHYAQVYKDAVPPKFHEKITEIMEGVHA